ncbi:hypothetical protein EV363DRAFT_1252288 [Boletus edulis]|uniref:Uncharacterized protein n=1 Tax=Boletus edulis BED1 TaxID=1328754 RepID=A0AAD4GKZ6_BOLED|nr:hypothetical protein EV363DRAFT_1252288 [Boletus edulis]KAF8450425.1 hypothetical protein L210DRAFT_290676 [Boletus edulis BED1]
MLLNMTCLYARSSQDSRRLRSHYRLWLKVGVHPRWITLGIIVVYTGITMMSTIARTRECLEHVHVEGHPQGAGDALKADVC